MLCDTRLCYTTLYYLVYQTIPNMSVSSRLFAQPLSAEDSGSLQRAYAAASLEKLMYT